MSDISLKIKLDSEEASKGFQAIAEASESAAKKISSFTEHFKTETIDRFIDRQNMAAVAMQATGRETDAVNAQVANYQREIERLIKAGLDPQDQAIQTLQGRYAELLTAQEANEAAVKAEAEAARVAAEQNGLLAERWSASADAANSYEKITAELTQKKKELKTEIENLIKSGIDPESEQIKKLEGDYKKLTGEIKATEDAHKLLEGAGKVLTGAIIGVGAAIGAAGAYAVKAAAANEDMIASFAPMMDGSFEKAGELFKTIQREAAATPFEIDKISASVKTLMPVFEGSATAAMDAFKMLGDTAQGNAQKLESITNAYSKTMMTGKVSMKELQTIAGAGVPIYDQMAKSMGVSTKELMKLSSEGKITSAAMTKAFKDMTSEGGLFYKGMETASDTFNMRVLGVKENLNIMAGVIGERLLPTMKDLMGGVLETVTGFTEWIQTGDNFENLVEKIKGIAVAVGILTAAVGAAFLIVKLQKAYEVATAAFLIIKGAVLAAAGAFKALTVAMAANPIGLIITGIVAAVALLVAGFIAVYKNWDSIKISIMQGAARLEYAFKWLASQVQEKFIIAVNGVKIGFLSLAEIIVKNVLGAVAKLLDVIGKIPGVGEKFKQAADAVRGFSQGFSDLTKEAKDASAAAIQNAKKEQDEIQKTLDSKLANIDAQAAADRAALAAKKEADADAKKSEIGNAKEAAAEKIAAQNKSASNEILIAEETEKKKKQIKEKSLMDILNASKLAELKEQEDSLKNVTQFLEQRAALESEGLESRITRLQENSAERIALERDGYAQQLAFLEENRSYLLDSVARDNEERIVMEQALSDAICDIQQKQADFEQQLLEKKLGALTTFTSGMGQLLELAAEKNAAAAVASKALAAAEAAINSYLAFTKALASAPPPFNYIAAAGVLASGIAQQVKILGTPIPSAETGGRFVVPDVSARVDNVGLRVNPGEEINVTPRGEEGGQAIILQLVIDGRSMTDWINFKARAGELHTLQLSGNL